MCSSRHCSSRCASCNQLADELTHTPRIHTNVRARLYAYPDPPSLPQQQRELADEIIELIKDRRLSARQAGQLERAFFFVGK